MFGQTVNVPKPSSLCALAPAPEDSDEILVTISEFKWRHPSLEIRRTAVMVAHESSRVVLDLMLSDGAPTETNMAHLVAKTVARAGQAKLGARVRVQGDHSARLASLAQSAWLGLATSRRKSVSERIWQEMNPLLTQLFERPFDRAPKSAPRKHSRLELPDFDQRMVAVVARYNTRPSDCHGRNSPLRRWIEQGFREQAILHPQTSDAAH